MNEFEVVTVIGRPVEEVFAVVREVTKAPIWTPGLSEVRRTSDGPLGVGATMVYVGTFLGRRYESPVMHGFRGEQAARHGNNRRAVPSRGRPDARAGRCWHQADDPLPGREPRLLQVAEPLVVRLTKRQVEAAGENLKSLLEEHAL